MLPSFFFSDRAQFTITSPNIIEVWREEHPDAKRTLLRIFKVAPKLAPKLALK